MSTYDFAAIESKWQREWEEKKTFHTPKDVDKSKPKFYVLDMFPYPSGVGLHVGHPLGYIATDISSRYKRMTGHNVLHPMGFDAFGLPAEQFAVEHGVHPRITTENNIENMLGQLKRLGLSYDWSRVISTTDEKYYAWTQWIFLQLYNSYYCDRTDSARLIADLETELENGSVFIDSDGIISDASSDVVIDWVGASETQREEVLSKIRLAFLAEVPVNWCPMLGTVLANEEVTTDNRSERGNYPVFRRPLKQWMLRITKYADRLAGDLDLVNWPEPIKLMQRNWIGRSEGAEVVFEVDESEHSIEVFTTRPDTLFGATYVVLSPEHPLVDELTIPEFRAAVDQYRTEAGRLSDIDRMVESRTKTGVFTGATATNPVNGESVPIWVADYVLMGYGTGAIMAVPGHDDRDFEFAKQFDLPIRVVVKPPKQWLKNCGVSFGEYVAAPESQDECFSGHGVAVQSAAGDLSLDGLATAEAKRVTIEWLEKSRRGAGRVQYKLRDWLFSRQRYWGEPFPILHGPDGEIVALKEGDLPVTLPPMEDFRPSATEDPDAPPRPPLGRAAEDWRAISINGVRYERELNTMPNWAGSCWYYLRFVDPQNDTQLAASDLLDYWIGPKGIDLYVGGAEHAVLHLLYARFWHKLLFDLGHVSMPEPFGKLVNQGYIQAYAYRDNRKIVVPSDDVVDQDGKPATEVQDQPSRKFFYNGEEVSQEYGKMGKSLKNAVNPDDIGKQYGFDTLRLYEMYLGPLEQSKPWNTRDIIGVHRFLRRVWRNIVDEDSGVARVSSDEPGEALNRQLHKTIQRVTDDLDRMSFNTAIAALIELNTAIGKLQSIPKEVAETLVLLLSPMAPHISEELWSKLGNERSLAYEAWPQADPSLLKDDTITIGVQVNGKLRGSIEIAADADKNSVLALAKSESNVERHLVEKTIRKEIYVPGKIVNLVVG